MEDGWTHAFRPVYLEREHACCFVDVVRVVDGDAEVVCFCSRFGRVDVAREVVVCGLPLDVVVCVVRNVVIWERV